MPGLASELCVINAAFSCLLQLLCLVLVLAFLLALDYLFCYICFVVCRRVFCADVAVLVVFLAAISGSEYVLFFSCFFFFWHCLYFCFVLYDVLHLVRSVCIIPSFHVRFHWRVGCDALF